jgi:hypothetical protein
MVIILSSLPVTLRQREQLLDFLTVSLLLYSAESYRRCSGSPAGSKVLDQFKLESAVAEIDSHRSGAKQGPATIRDIEITDE